LRGALTDSFGVDELTGFNDAVFVEETVFQD